jgi:toxin-antitoxin system PIN domain toxin
VIAVDTNVLVYAHRSEAPQHERAARALASLAGSRWAIPWACVHEFVGVVTNTRIFTTPTPAVTAFEALSAAQDAGAVFLGESSDHLARLAGLLAKSGAAGPKVHDARIAAVCLSHGVSELWTADRDFGYFPDLRTRNPLVG